MKRMMIAVASLALVFGTVTCVRRVVENRLVVENRSGQRLVTLRIDLHNGGHVTTFQSIPNGGAVTANFWIGGDDRFAVRGTLADGTKVGGDFGYVTNGEFGVHPRFVIRQAGRIDFSQ